MFSLALLWTTSANASDPVPTTAPEAVVAAPVDVIDPVALRAAIRQQLIDKGVEAAELEATVEAVAADVEFEKALTWQTGDVTIGDGLAVLHLGEAWSFVGPSQAADILQRWGNPRPTVLPLGMVAPTGLSPLSADGWGAFVTYSEEGHVDDADAAATDYDEMLEGMKAATREAAQARRDAGYEALELVGWAEPPHYDPVTKRLYWARHLRAETGESLNYDIRVLGREGVVELSAVAQISQLESVKKPMEDLLGRVELNEGHRYADFDPDVDKLAAYGIGALIAGKVVAKAGMFKVLIAAMIAGKKFILAGAIFVIAMGSKWMKRARVATGDKTGGE